jgi:hypothetical protein
MKNLSFKCFCNWVPRVPKHKIGIDKSSYKQPHPYWDLKDAEKVEITHESPKTVSDKLAFLTVKILRNTYDKFTGYNHENMNEKKYLRRAIFLETVAGVPGMIGGMVRHLRAIRNLTDDKGWIHHLLEEAENERMHLTFFLRLRQPGKLMRWAILGSQYLFILYYSALYLLSSKSAHRFIGYLEEEAVKTYTQMIDDLDKGKLKLWENMNAPEEAIKYYGLKNDAKIRDMLICIRADETNHREFNHHLSDINKDERVKGHEIYVFEKVDLNEEKKLNDKLKLN